MTLWEAVGKECFVSTEQAKRWGYAVMHGMNVDPWIAYFVLKAMRRGIRNFAVDRVD